MSGKKNRSDLNISGFSPMVLNLLSPQSTKNSPAKNQAVIEAINTGANKLIAGYQRWKVNEQKGLNSLNIIHSLREKSKTSSEPQSFTELEVCCEQLKAIETILLSIVNEVAVIKSQIETSISIQRTMSISSEDPILQQLISIEKFLNMLKQLYESGLSIKKEVIEFTSCLIPSQRIVYYLMRINVFRLPMDGDMLFLL
ncbi:hypothetical protein ACKWTF_001587 [Chironomus riparius]